MKTTKYIISALLVLFIASPSFSQTSYNFSDGLNAAKSGGKMIFLNIYSESDSWSKKMESEVYSSAKVQTGLSNFIFIKLNADGQEKFKYGQKDYTSGELAKFFGGTGYPTFVFLNPNGSVIKFKYNGDEDSSLSGFIGADDLVELLDFFASNKYKDTDLSTVFQN